MSGYSLPVVTMYFQMPLGAGSIAERYCLDHGLVIPGGYSPQHENKTVSDLLFLTIFE